MPALLDAVGVERALLVGHSGSCLVARRVALERPDRVAALVLEASPITLVGEARFGAFVDPGAGHTPRWDEPARFASDLTEFAERVSAMSRVTPRSGAGPSR